MEITISCTLKLPQRGSLNMTQNNTQPKKEYTFVYTKVNDAISSKLLSDMKEVPSIQIGDYNYHLEFEELTPDLQEIARNELRETPEVVEDAVKTLRELLKEDKELYAPSHKDSWLIRFLRPCKFYPESAFKLIQRYYHFKVKHADVYDALMPSNERTVFEQNILLFQQERDQFGRRILTIKLGKKWKPSVVTLDQFFKGAVLLLELGLLEPITQVCGVVVILDMDGLSLSQTTKFTPHFVKRLLDWLQDSAPVRLKYLHIVNQPYIFKIIYKIFKLFLREKLKSRIIFHGTDRASLYKYIDQECLLEDYGGSVKLPVIEGSPWYELLRECDKEYEVINKYGYKKNAKDKHREE